MLPQPSDKLPLLEAKDVSYGTPEGKTLAEGISFQLRGGESLLVEGPNGAGKSTLLKVLLGYQKALGGTIAHRVPRRRVAYIPQLQNTDFHLPISLGDLLPPKCDLEKWSLLTRSQTQLAWNTASGGERKRALLCRALFQDCSLLVLDEPFNHPDTGSKEQMQKALVNFLEGNQDRALVLVSHEVPSQFKNVRRLQIGFGR